MRFLKKILRKQFSRKNSWEIFSKKFSRRNTTNLQSFMMNRHWLSLYIRIYKFFRTFQFQKDIRSQKTIRQNTKKTTPQTILFSHTKIFNHSNPRKTSNPKNKPTQIFPPETRGINATFLRPCPRRLSAGKHVHAPKVFLFIQQTSKRSIAFTGQDWYSFPGTSPENTAH